ncbi:MULTISPECIES: LysR family transcriptional regulator [Lactobacillaceae]|uniref:LysR family transcriptional regulator n=1 Tax=Lactobacillaceae TaxID=33958 RepID=UPI000C1B614C|nr:MULTISPECIES: LysR family transcriptional regulator [Lactobacillaceae]
MNIKDYQYFVKLNQFKNFSDTAKYFHVSQPTITYSLKRLEDEYNAKLIERKSYANSFYLTLSGLQVLTHAQRIISENEISKKEVQKLNSQKFRVGMPPIITNYLFPKKFVALNESGILSRIISVQDGSKELVYKLKNGDVDISLLGYTNQPDDPDLIYEEIDIKDFKVITSFDKKMSDKVSISDIKDETFILLDEQSIHNQVFQNMIRQYNFLPNTIYSTNDYNLLLNLVKENRGISFIAEIALDNIEGVRSIDITDVEIPKFHIAIAYRRTMEMTDYIQEFIDIFRNNS